jgi:pimeloyl-ACP methyl ester carboxylesterase
MLTSSTPRAIDRTIDLNVNGARQRIRLCAERKERPPLLVVQGGPGLPLLHEVAKFQQRLDLERDFLVGYWEQRGCGDAPRHDAERVTCQQQVADLCTVLQWFAQQTAQRVILLGISLGGTFALQAVEGTLDRVKAVVAVSPDSHTSLSDAAADAFLRSHGRNPPAPPPYVKPSMIQRRARLLADLGTIEHGQTFAALFREMVFGLFRTYGAAGAIRTLRNMNVIQRRMLPELASLDLFANPPRVAVPVHYVFGGQDALNPRAIVDHLPAVIAAPGTTVTVVPESGHMVHFDRPDVVRSIAVKA